MTKILVFDGVVLRANRCSETPSLPLHHTYRACDAGASGLIRRCSSVSLAFFVRRSGGTS